MAVDFRIAFALLRPIFPFFPMPDAAHVRAAEAYFRYAPENKKSELARNILAKAREYGVNVKSETILSWARHE